MDKVREGRFWETAAAEYLRQAGVQILEQNFRCSQGEIDLIGCHQGCLTGKMKGSDGRRRLWEQESSRGSVAAPTFIFTGAGSATASRCGSM